MVKESRKEWCVERERERYLKRFEKREKKREREVDTAL